jgi:7-dehydrocholesterol reductase
MEQISLSSSVGTTAAKFVATEVSLLQNTETAKWATTHGVGDRNSVWALSGNLGRLLHSLGTAAILLSFPFIAVFLWPVVENYDGSATHFIQSIFSINGLEHIKQAYPRPSWLGFRYLAIFGILQAFLQITLPGKKVFGPPTPKGNVPVYKSNGILSYIVTIVLFTTTWHAGIFNPAAVYDATGTIISSSNIFSFLLCLFLYVKGRYAPSSSDSGHTGSFLFDFYWGMELYPRLGRHFDIKTWTNCRMGMMSWAVLTLCYAAKQASLSSTGYPSLSMLVTVGLMQIYIIKFYLWEDGYWASMDIAHDRAGYYLCWGCLVWVPAVYTSPAMYLVKQPGDFLGSFDGILGNSTNTTSVGLASIIFLVGVLSIYVNYDSDRQRHYFRRTKGKCLIWGQPPRKIHAKYITANGHVNESLLLASGWWGVARHFHYAPELMAAFMWSCTAGTASIVPYLYLMFLTALLVDRSYRDDERCRAKYGKSWEKYCELVPYRIMPFLF